jgi:FemAB-related protein (PEP-CTERM system-associated)
MSLEVILQDEATAPAWSGFVASEPAATLFHTLEWRAVLERTFRHRCHYLIARAGTEVQGILPLVEIRSLFFGRSLVSVPFGVYGGIVARTPDAAAHLARHAAGLASRLRSRYVELRHQDPPPGVDLPDSRLYATFVRDLPSDPGQVLGLIPRKARAEVRRAREDQGLEVTTGGLDLEAFHRLFADNKRRLGSPIFPRSLFLNLVQVLRDRSVILCVRHRGEPMAAVMSFLWRDTYMAYYSGATEAANAFSANNLMYCAAMEDAVRRGYRRFDFGRSRVDTGSYSFKKNQGFEPRPLHYQFIIRDGAALPEVHASNPRYDLAKRVFRSLPRPLAEKLGSFVAKRMPV